MTMVRISRRAFLCGATALGLGQPSFPCVRYVRQVWGTYFLPLRVDETIKAPRLPHLSTPINSRGPSCATLQPNESELVCGILAEERGFG
jgi:hypothetical protein